MEKITILTLFDAQNIGAFLQAYSLQTFLEKLGYKVEFGRFGGFSKQKNNYTKILAYLKRRQFGTLLFKLRSNKKYTKMKHLLKLSDGLVNTNQKYDIVVVGSDEVWNVKSNNFVHHPEYFGENISCKKIISYAACSNNTTTEDLNQVDKNINFENFSMISVRDYNTNKLVKEKSPSTNPEIVLDPTFLLSSKDLDDKIPENNMNNFILVYSYGLSQSEIRVSKMLKKRMKMKLISVGTYNSCCDYNIVADAFEFLGYLKNASLVITSTFHGVALSLKYQKQFYVFGRNSHKINYLLKLCGISKMNISNNEDTEDIINRKICYNDTKIILDKNVDKSIQFLKKSLSC